MKFSQSTVLAFAATALAAPQKPRQAAGCASAVKLDASTNVFKKYTLHPNSFFRAEVEAAAAAMSGAAAASAAKVADVGSFLWLDTIENIGKLEPALKDVPCEHILGLVIYDLPGRDCAAKASNGELKVGELAKYKSEYIDSKFYQKQTSTKEKEEVKLTKNRGRHHPQSAPQHGLRARHRARLAAQPSDQQRPDDVPEQRVGLPRRSRLRA